VHLHVCLTKYDNSTANRAMATEIATELDLVPQFCRYAFGAKRTKVKGQRSNSQGQNQF